MPKTVYLRLRKTEVERVAVIKFRVNNSQLAMHTGCFEIKMWKNASKVTM